MLVYLDQIIHCDFSGLIQPEKDDSIHPCCKSPDYLLGDLNEQNVLNDFLKDDIPFPKIT